MAKTRGKSVTAGTEKLRNLKPFKPGQRGNPKGARIARARRSPSSELRRIVVGVTEITDEGGLTNGAKTQDTAGSPAH